MRHDRFVRCIIFAGVAVVVLAAMAAAQAPERRASTPSPPASLNQLMRAVLFVNANVIFAAQDSDPTAIKPDAQTSTSTDPLKGVYGGWQAVENSSLALAEAAGLLTTPGRRCANGKPVPTGNADWTKFVQGLRDAGMASYRAAQAKDQDAVLEAADLVVTACGNCHEVYRDKGQLGGQLAARCVK